MSFYKTLTKQDSWLVANGLTTALTLWAHQKCGNVGEKAIYRWVQNQGISFTMDLIKYFTMSNLSIYWTQTLTTASQRTIGMWQAAWANMANRLYWSINLRWRMSICGYCYGYLFWIFSGHSLQESQSD